MKKRWHQAAHRFAFLFASALLFSACTRPTAAAVVPSEPAPPAIAPEAVAPAQSEAVAAALDMSPVGNGGVFLFTDDFQDGEPDNWETTGAWYVEQTGDAYIFGATGAGWAWVPSGHFWTGYAFHAGVRIERGTLFLSTNLTADGRYLLRLNENELALIKEQPAGNVEVLATTGPIGTGIGRSVILAAQHGRFQVYVDEELWIDYVDPSPITAGTIGVSSLEDSIVAVDNIFVLQLTGDLPAGETIVSPPPLADPIAPEEVAAEIAEVPLVDVDESFAEVEQEQEELAAEAEQQGSLPDLEAFAVEFAPDPVVQGQPFQIVLYVINRGEAPSGAFTIRLHFHAATGVPDCNADFAGLAIGEGGTAFCTSVTSANSGSSPTEFSVDVEGEINEMDEGNNMLAGTFVVAAAQGDMDEPEANLVPPVECAAEALSGTEVRITWNVPGALSGHEGFRVYQGEQSLEQEIGEPGLRVTLIDNLAPSTQYHFDVRAYNAAGESESGACSVDVTTLP